ncbi:MAG: hypothetical protein WA265_19790, partial [Rhodomicrobium sp.]
LPSRLYNPQCANLPAAILPISRVRIMAEREKLQVLAALIGGRTLRNIKPGGTLGGTCQPFR